MSEINKKPEDQVVAAYKGQSVITFTDWHTVSDAVHDAAIATALRLKKPLGLEILLQGKVYLDAYKAGEITRAQYIDFVSPKSMTIIPGSIPSYIGPERYAAMMGRLADAVKIGLKVVPLGMSLGGVPGVDTEEKADIYDRRQHLLSAARYKTWKFQQSEKADIEKNPKTYYERYAAKVMQQFDHLSEGQKKVISSLMGSDKINSQDYEVAIINVHKVLLPEARQVLELEEKGKKIGLFPLKTELTEQGLSIRRSQDQVLGRKIKGMIDKDGMVVVQGLSHTTKDKDRKGMDIDGTLRSLGVSVLIVDPKIKPDQICLICPTQQDRIETGKLYTEFMKRAAADGDPSRISIDLDLSPYVTPAPSKGPVGTVRKLSAPVS